MEFCQAPLSFIGTTLLYVYMDMTEKALGGFKKGSGFQYLKGETLGLSAKGHNSTA
jgi:hypothetical protein